MKTTIAEAKNKAAARKIPYVDIAKQHAPLKKRLLEAIGRVIDHGQFILGDEVKEFEKRFAELCGVRFAVAVNSGTDALIFALRVLNIGPGDEVITAPNSFVSTASCIALLGARPVFADVGEDYNLNASLLEKAVTPKTKAIIPVHLTGRPANMDAILKIAIDRGIAVIEDSAQAILAEYKGKKVGSFGNLGCFSLHPLKTLNACGDGGVITTGDEGFYQRLCQLRNLGLETRDECAVWSNNSRLDSIQAASLLVKMDHLEEWTAKRREHAAYYQKALSGISQVKVPVDFPHEKSVYHTFVILAENRDGLKKHLEENGIGTAIHYPIPIHLQAVSKSLGHSEGSFPVAEEQAKKALSLPVYPDLKKEDLEYIVKKIGEFYPPAQKTFGLASG